MSDIAEEDTALQQQWCRLLFRSGRVALRYWRAILLLQQGVALADLLRAVLSLRMYLLATEDDLLEQEDVVLAVNVGLRDGEDLIEKQAAEVL